MSKASGIASVLGEAWGVVATDVNHDGRMDLFVANDTVATEGRPRSGMGLDSADFDQDGWMDLFVAHIDHETFSLYQNNHDETIDDRANATVIGPATRLMSGWGLKFFDYDNDGNLDLFLANGNPDDLIEELTQNQVHYREPLLLLHNDGKGWEKRE